MTIIHRLCSILIYLALITQSVVSAPENISQIQSVDTLANQLVLHSQASGNHPLTFYCSFPSFGGIRIHSDTSGFFVPQSVGTIHYLQTQAGLVASTQDNDLVLNVLTNPLRISVVKQNGNIIRLFSDSTLFVTFDTVSNILAGTRIVTPLEPTERLFGFGERYPCFGTRPDTFTIWQSEMAPVVGNIYNGNGNSSVGYFPAYKQIPFFHSLAGYSMFVNSTYKMFVDIGQEIPDRFQMTINGPILDFYIWGNDPLKNIQSFTDLTGKPVLPPKWAFEPWAGGGVVRWGSNPLSEVMKVVNRFKAEDIPHSAVYVEQTGSNVWALYDSLKRNNLRLLAWWNSETSLNRARQSLPGVNDLDLPVVRRADGSVFIDTYNQAYIDFTNSRSVDLVRANLKNQLDHGLAGSMTDFGDQLPEDVRMYNGRSGAQMHNYYAHEYNRVYSQVFNERRGADHILFSRSAAVGSQQLVCQFSGDLSSDIWGIIVGIKGGMNLCASGFSTWGTDIGGYYTSPNTYVYINWVQFGCFSPLMRCHGYTAREPWYFAPDTLTVPIYKYYTWLRENMLDYIYSNAINAHKTGIPIMQALPLAFPGKPELVLDNEYMFGPDMLVAPTYTKLSREYLTVKRALILTLPPGRWVHLWTNKVFDAQYGPKIDTVPYPFDSIPVLLKEGALVPLRLNKQLQLGKSMTPGSVAALLTTPPLGQPSVRPFYTSEDTVVTYTSTNGVNSYTVTADKTDKTPYLLVYGATVTGVKVGTQEISQLQTLPITIGTQGWLADPLENGRYIICLPGSGWTSVTISTQGVGVQDALRHTLSKEPAFRIINVPGKGLSVRTNTQETYSCRVVSLKGEILA